MIRNNTKRNVALFIGMVFNAGNLGNVLHYILNCVNLKEIVNVLCDTSESFKTHSGINIRMSKRRVVVVSVVLKLSKNKVPELNISVALTAYLTVGLAATMLGSSVVINL